MAKVMTPAQRILADVPEDRIFWVHDGTTLKNLKELNQALSTMTDETYMYHHNAERMDFVNWVRDVIADDKLAGELARSPSRMQAARTVQRRIAELSK